MGRRDVQTQFAEKEDAIQPKTYKDAAIGGPSNEKSVQTESLTVLHNVPPQHLRPLKSFLKSRENEVLTQLQRNLESQTEKEYQVEWKAFSQEIHLVSKFHTDLEGSADAGCTKVEWNCNGSLIAVAVGNDKHEDLCFHKASIRLWKLFVGRVRQEPEVTIELAACVTSLSFHPRRTTFLSAALFTGEIFVWDVTPSTSGAVVIGHSPGLRSNAGHTDIITALNWISLTSANRTYMLLSSGLDGRLIIWKNSSGASAAARNGQLHATAQPALILPSKSMITQNQETLLMSQWSSREQQTATIGITVAHALPEGQQPSCLIATDTGLIGSCSLQHFKDVGSPIEAVLSFGHNTGYKSHTGPVTSICRSPFLDSCFLTTSTDGKVRLYHLLKWEPILEVIMDEGVGATCSDWSPFRPSIFALGTSSGHLQFFDVLSTQVRNAAAAVSLQVTSSALLSVKFNKHHSDIIAVTSSEGSGLWTVPEILSVSGPDERQHFNKLIYHQENDTTSKY